ncbi:MAG TPA: PrgI family protein [Candidatus Moranbacteria bacterium]|nr:PrgI family protein [Candidatus Moranbacteria bacterium]
MHYNVPQFIDIEDKIVGPLTAKQLLWMFAMGGVLLILWATVGNKINFFIIGIPIALAFVALAFYRPYGQPLSKFITSAFLFIVKPKIYIWRREIKPEKKKKITEFKKINNFPEKKKMKQEELHQLAEILDSENKILK